MKIVVTDGSAPNPGDLSWDAFAALGELTVYDATPPELLCRRLSGADAVIVNRTPINGAALAACPSVRYVGLLSTGYNQIDLDAARERGVTVTNVPAYSTGSVAQFTFALLLELVSRVSRLDALVQSGRWEDAPRFCAGEAPLMELAGKTLGIVGYGHIGQAVARIALALRMKVLVNTPHPEKSGPIEGITFTDIDTLLSQSDVLSLHCPLNDHTRRLICAGTIAKMRDGAILINTARGAVVDEDDLAAALRSGKLAAAGLDVLTDDPPSPDNPLLGLPNCIVTPHMAWATPEARGRDLQIAADNLKGWLEGRVQNTVV